MGFFTRARKTSGWLAFRLQQEGVSVACVRRPPGALPVVEAIAFAPAAQGSQSAVLERLGKELHAVRYECSNLLSADEYQILAVDAPTVEPDELKTAIRWRLKDMLDYRVDDATIDVLDVPLDKNAPARNHQMYAVAARNQMIQARQRLFEEARLPLRVIDIPEMAQRNIAALLEQEGRGLAMLSFDRDGGLLTITHAAELYLSRRIDVSQESLSHSDGDARQRAYDRITLELQRSLDHFDRQYHYVTMSRLLLAPLGGQADELGDYLRANLYLPVEQLALDGVLDLSAVPALRSTAEQQRHFLTLGAALRHEEKAL